MPEILKLTRAGNPILREEMPRLSGEEILSDEIQRLIENMYHTVRERKYGVGLAAPQVGVWRALSVISIRPTPLKPQRKLTEFVIINPTYEGVGERVGFEEGCISMNLDDGDVIPVETLRYKEVDARWIDREGNEKYIRKLGGFTAHVFQHETDHLNGKVIF